MTLITKEQFDNDFVEDFPEMEQCYGSLLDMHMDHTDGMNWEAWEENLQIVANTLGCTADDLIDMELHGEIAYGYA